jgi:hypothetical protein
LGVLRGLVLIVGVVVMVSGLAVRVVWIVIHVARLSSALLCSMLCSMLRMLSNPPPTAHVSDSTDYNEKE